MSVKCYSPTDRKLWAEVQPVLLSIKQRLVPFCKGRIVPASHAPVVGIDVVETRHDELEGLCGLSFRCETPERGLLYDYRWEIADDMTLWWSPLESGKGIGLKWTCERGLGTMWYVIDTTTRALADTQRGNGAWGRWADNADPKVRHVLQAAQQEGHALVTALKGWQESTLIAYKSVELIENGIGNKRPAA